MLTMEGMLSLAQSLMLQQVGGLAEGLATCPTSLSLGHSMQAMGFGCHGYQERRAMPTDASALGRLLRVAALAAHLHRCLPEALATP